MADTKDAELKATVKKLIDLFRTRATDEQWQALGEALYWYEEEYPHSVEVIFKAIR